MPRVMFVVNNPVFGGGQGQFIRLREPLAKRGWETVAVTPTGADAAARLRAGGVEVEEVPLHRLRAKPDPRLQVPFLASMPREIRGLRQLIERRGIDVVQAHGDTNPHAAFAAHRAGRAVVWQLYDTVTPVKLRRLTMPLVTRVADVITTWGRQLGLDYPGTASLGERWIPVFPPVAEDTFVVSPERRAAARAELGLPHEAIAVALVGMRNPTKGHDHFVQALAKARESNPKIYGRMLGPPSPAHEEYERGFRAEADRLGLMRDGVLDLLDAGARVPELLPGFDLLALSSVPRSEGMPTVILEAMACGLPVVVTRVGAVAEEVVDGETGLIVEPLDDDAFAAALNRLAADADLRSKMGAAGHQRFEQRFRLDVLADIHVRAFELAIEHRRSR